MNTSLDAQPRRGSAPSPPSAPTDPPATRDSIRSAPHASLARQFEALERSNAALRRFATLVAHDLRAPARQMSGFAKLLGHELGGRMRPHESEMLRQVEQGALQMQELVTELLEAAGPRSIASEEEIDLDHLGRTLQDEFEIDLREQGSRLVWLASGRVSVHAPTVRRVLHNLINNALRHAGAGTTISVLHETRGGGPEFLVSDNGTGVESDAFCSLFHGARESEAERVGAGPAPGPCRQLLEARRGWIRAEPHARGSAFRFALPSGPSRRFAPS